MEPTIANHEKRLLDLNVQLDNKYRDIIQAVSDVANKYPNRRKQSHQAEDSVIPSRSRGVLTLNQKKFVPPVPLLKRPIPLPDKRGSKKHYPLHKMAELLKVKGKNVSADVHITHGND